MLIKILGTRGEIALSAPGHTKHSGVLIDNKILLDIGESEYLAYNPTAILITHLHPDHAFFLRGKESNFNMPVYAPEASEKMNAIEVVSEPFSIGEYEITPIPTIHSVHVKSQGYIIQKGNKRVFYSSDLVTIDQQYCPHLQRLDMVITEGSFIRKGGLVRRSKDGQQFGHAGIPDLVNLFSQFTNHIVFMHFGTWFIKDPTQAKEKILSFGKNDLKIDVASDGAEYKI
jgi:ribonuclease BN (tRNA processing enzyme)